MPPKKTKKRERSLNSPKSSIVNDEKKIKSNPVPPSQAAIMPVQTSQTPIISPPFSQPLFINDPDLSEFQNIDEWARKSYSVDIDSYQWIDPNLIAYRRLLHPDKFPLYENKVLVMKFPNENASDEIIKIMEQGIKYKAYFRGPSGVGKSYDLIQTVFKIRKNFNHKYRVLHIILNLVNVEEAFDWFPQDFIYCFCNDFDDIDFPSPPKEKYFVYNESIKKGENWFKFLKRKEYKTLEFLIPIKNYFKKKKIKMILFWDQDNVYQKWRLIPYLDQVNFLESIRNSGLFHFKLLSASNSNDVLGFQNLDSRLGYTIIESSMGFSKENMISFIQILMTKANIDFEIDTDVIFDLTNGIGYLVSKFMQTEGKNLQEKLKNFVKEISDQMQGKILTFFHEKMKQFSDNSWIEIFPQIVNYIDQEIKVPVVISFYIDQNFTYLDKNSYLKSICNLAKSNILDCYLDKLNYNDKENRISHNMWCAMQNLSNNETRKRWALKNFITMKFYSNLFREFTLQYQEKLTTGELTTEKCSLSIRIQRLKFFLSFKEINDIAKESTNVLLISYFERNEYFDFLFWDEKEKILHVFKITINEEDKESDKEFFEKNNLDQYHSLKKDQIKFFWIALIDRNLKSMMNIGSFLIYIEENSIQQN